MIRLSHPTQFLKGTINMPSSKSICNRMLMLQKLYEPEMHLDNISNANDSVLLKNILDNDIRDIDVHDAGTALRFLVAYCAITNGEWTIRGTERLHQRPISQLVDLLRSFGADISYLEEEGFAPLRIVGKPLKAPTTLIDVSNFKSSQFVSAILLIAPLIEGEFNLNVSTRTHSYSYILLTVSCLRRMGFSVYIRGRYISVQKQQKFDAEYFKIEPDWSSFYYWVSMVHLAKEVDLFFPGIRLDNMQKERKRLFDVGNREITFEEINGGMRIMKKRQGELECNETSNFAQFPDSAMTFAMLLPALGCEFHVFEGLDSLKYKECDREAAIANHLQKVKVDFKKVEEHWELRSTEYTLAEDTLFESYDDHRMAMCAAPLALQKPIRIENESVVKKSYPHFWEDLKSVGFEIKYL